MGTIKTTNIETITGSGTLTLGQSGETISVPSGATINLSNATQTGVGGVNTPAFGAYSGSDIAITNATETTIVFGSEYYDSDSAYDTSTGKFTPQTAGKYLVSYSFTIDSGQSSNMQYSYSYIEKNSTNLLYAKCDFRSNPGRGAIMSGSALVDMNGSTDFLRIQLYVYADITGSGFKVENRGTFSGFKIIE